MILVEIIISNSSSNNSHLNTNPYIRILKSRSAISLLKWGFRRTENPGPEKQKGVIALLSCLK
jgi:hypothetical protein